MRWWLLIAVSLCALAYTGTAPPDTRHLAAREILVAAGSTHVRLQNALNDAAAKGIAVFIDGDVRVGKPVDVPPGMTIRAYNATLIGTAPGPILRWNGGGTLDGVAFRAEVNGVIGVQGYFERARIVGCKFWTNIAYCIDGTGLLTTVERCEFGVWGPISPQHQHIRIRGDGNVNAWKVRDCAFMHATGECAIEFGDGHQLDLDGCEIEDNRARTTVKIAGMSSIHIHHCWFEKNDGESQVELVPDAANSIPNWVESDHNWWVMSGAGNVRAYLNYGNAAVDFHHEQGGNWDGKEIASAMQYVRTPGREDWGAANRLVGYGTGDK